MPVKANEKYGKLKTIHLVAKGSKVKSATWLCECDCGNKEFYTTAKCLQSYNTQSCGCLHKESLRKMGEKTRKLNTYDLTDEYGIGYTTSGDKFYFDLEDYDKIKNYTWRLNDNGYILTSFFAKQMRLHRLIMGVEKDKNYDVDHKDRNPLNNRKSNLRICDHYKNMINSSMYSSNTTGRKGVYWDKNRNKWMALITTNKVNKHLGRFENFEDAVAAREKAEKIYHKEFTGQTQLNQ